MSRREFTEPVKDEIRERSGGLCESAERMPPDLRGYFPKGCTRPAVDIDHVYADVLEEDEAKQEPLTADDGAHLCKPCHTIKTHWDQRARATRNHHTPRKGRPKSGWFSGKGRPLQGRGFDKTFKKKFDGTVERRE